MKQESKFKSLLKQFAKTELPGFVIFYVAGVGTDGVPDLSFNGYSRSSWWEVKHAIGKRFETKDNQELMCSRLAATTLCRYIVFHETTKGDVKRILIIDPRHVLGKGGYVDGMAVEAWTTGYDYRWLCEQVRLAHVGALTPACRPARS